VAEGRMSWAPRWQAPTTPSGEAWPPNFASQ
jgi:hypothetical protein